MNQNYRLKINRRTGDLQWLNPPPFRLAVHNQKRERFSEIVPENPILRLWFRLLRYIFGGRGAVAMWTRSWVVMWRLTILQGPHAGFSLEHGLRAVLLEIEQEMWFKPRFDL